MRAITTVTGLAAIAAGGFWALRRGQRTTPPSAPLPGGPKQFSSRYLQAGAALLQDKSPVRAMNLYLDGFHFYADNMGHQMEAHHYCTQLSEDFHQCAIFDGNTPEAKLIGVEYIISARLFETLPDEEKTLWHSHHYEVTSGTLIAPGLPAAAEHRLMEKVITTYGKTWHTWDSVHDELPLGIPHLMMGFTQDGQIQRELVKDRDHRFGVSTERCRHNRADIPMPDVHPQANAWEHGEVRQLELAQRSRV